MRTQRMLSAGMINAVVPDDALDGQINGYVGRLRQCGPGALAATKQLLRKASAMSRDEAFAWTAELSASLFGSREAKAGMSAFLSCTPAPWAQ